ncbi:MAG: hypothetical protein MNPFHGCM_01689 [Gemmatimonadaceae bacterium]|nr:hypothetical protein [Gemmatimonadaceae bacterium]
MRAAFRSFAFVLLLTTTVSGCYRGKGSVLDEQPQTLLTVDNQNFLDFTIYLLAGGQRVRLGTATGNRKTRLIIPAQYIFGATTLQFQADPIGGNRAPVSYPLTVSPGDEVELTIPPNA